MTPPNQEDEVREAVLRESILAPNEVVGWLSRNHPDWLETATLGARGDKLARMLVEERTSSVMEPPRPLGHKTSKLGAQDEAGS